MEARMAGFILLALIVAGCSGVDGEVGAAGAAGEACWAGLTDLNGDGVVDAKDCLGVAGADGTDGIACWDLNANGIQDHEEDTNRDGSFDAADCQGSEGNRPHLTQAEVDEIEGRVGVEECLLCHKGTNPNMVEDFVYSTMAINGVACIDCHADRAGVPPGEGHRMLPTPNTCATCHPDEYEGHRANRHSIASIRDFECGRFDDFPRFFDNGSGYHFNDADVAQLQDLMDSGGNGAGANENPTAIAKCMQCHNVENRCDSCHTRHRFSTQEARTPGACGTCHMGPDHPQIEMYETSKHGAMYEAEGDTDRVPVCVDCHMPYNDKIFPRKTNSSGEPYTSHNLSETIAYGPVGGGTVRTGFISENDRVKLLSKEPAGVAAYDELWYSWADGKVYTDAQNSTVAFENIHLMSLADLNANGKQDYAVAQPADSAEKLEGARDLMLDVCTKCHANNFADERLLVADLIHENVKKTQLEAWDIVTALAAADIGPYSTVGDRPTNPDRGDNDLEANMKVRNLTALEREYFNVMKYDQVKAWKGAYHFNPDYTHWYGWTALNLTLGAIGDMATQQVLQNLWVNGLDYPGANNDVWSDGLYQGVFFVNGLDETRQNENYYDKFPGPGDSYLDWFEASGLFDDAGDGVADHEQDIDIDGDGVFDLLRDDGTACTSDADCTISANASHCNTTSSLCNYNPGVYRAPATGKVIVLH